MPASRLAGPQWQTGAGGWSDNRLQISAIRSRPACRRADRPSPFRLSGRCNARAGRAARKPFESLKKEITEAFSPLIEETEQQAQELVQAIEALFAKTDVLRGITRSGRIEGVWLLMGTMVISARESRYVSSQGEIPIDPALSALSKTEPLERFSTVMNR